MKKVSVVIPCRNEEKNIAACIESIYASDYPDIEVVVADGMSDDSTREVLTALQTKYETLKVVDNPEKLTPYAFNAGIKNSDGFYVQIVGSRNILAPDYISLLVKTLEENPEIGCVGGDYQHVYETPKARFISWAMESPFGVGASNYRTKKESCYVDTVGIPMYRRSIFDELGYFDEVLTRNQDDDFNYRLTQAGHKIYYVAEAKTQYTVRGTFTKLMKQFSQYGYFKVFVNRKHKVVTTKRQLAPIFFLLFLIFGGALSIVDHLFARFYFLLLIIYWTLGLATASRFTRKFKEISLIQWAIFVMHMGYALGYLRGIKDFLILRKKTPAGSMQKQTT